MFLGVGTQHPIFTPLSLLTPFSHDKWHFSPFGREMDDPHQNERKDSICYCAAQLNTNHLHTCGEIFEIMAYNSPFSKCFDYSGKEKTGWYQHILLSKCSLKSKSKIQGQERVWRKSNLKLWFSLWIVSYNMMMMMMIVVEAKLPNSNSSQLP